MEAHAQILAALVHRFTSILYASTRIHATSMLVSLSYAPLELIETHVQAT